MNTPLDTRRLNETPEGIELGLRLAGPVVRALALVLDALIRLVLYLVLLPLFGLGGLGLGLILLATFLIEWLYPVVFEVMRGATPGKRALGLRVIHDDGTPVGLSASLIRNLLRVVDFLPLFYGLGLLATLIDRDFRRLGDLAAGTLVIYAESARGAAREQAAHRMARPGIPPPPALALETQRAILAFAERSSRLSNARQIELAEILAQTQGARGPAALALVEGWAAWLGHGHDPEATR